MAGAVYRFAAIDGTRGIAEHRFMRLLAWIVALSACGPYSPPLPDAARYEALPSCASPAAASDEIVSFDTVTP